MEISQLKIGMPISVSWDLPGMRIYHDLTIFNKSGIITKILQDANVVEISFQNGERYMVNIAVLKPFEP